MKMNKITRKSFLKVLAATMVGAAPVSAEAAAPPTMVAARTFRKLLRVILFIFIYPFIWFIFRKKLFAPSYKLLEIYF